MFFLLLFWDRLVYFYSSSFVSMFDMVVWEVVVFFLNEGFVACSLWVIWTFCMSFDMLLVCAVPGFGYGT